MNKVDRFKKKLDEDLDKYIKTSDFNTAISEITKYYDKEIINYLDNKRSLDNYFIDLLFKYSIPLNKKKFNEYVLSLKCERIYRYKNSIVNRLLLKYFTKEYIKFYFFRYKKNGGYKFFEYKKSINVSNKKMGMLYVDYTEIVITTKCTLNCKNCSNLIPLYKKPYDVSDDLVKKSIINFFSSVDYVDTFRILGGEPFCNPKLKDYLGLIDYSKVRYVDIVTNGTICPSDSKLYELLSKYNVTISISDYGKHSKNISKLIKKLEEYGISYNIKEKDIYWYDYGKVIDYKRSKKELKRQINHCDTIYKSILNGCLYYCPRYSHGYDLGLIKRKRNEYIDLINDSKETIRRKMGIMMKMNRYNEACKYCLYGTSKCKKIEPAVQSERKKCE